MLEIQVDTILLRPLLLWVPKCVSLEYIYCCCLAFGKRKLNGQPVPPLSQYGHGYTTFFGSFTTEEKRTWQIARYHIMLTSMSNDTDRCRTKNEWLCGVLRKTKTRRANPVTKKIVCSMKTKKAPSQCLKINKKLSFYKIASVASRKYLFCYVMASA